MPVLFVSAWVSWLTEELLLQYLGNNEVIDKESRSREGVTSRWILKVIARKLEGWRCRSLKFISRLILGFSKRGSIREDLKHQTEGGSFNQEEKSGLIPR